MKRILIPLFSILLILACSLPTPAPVATPTPILQTYPTITITPSPTLTLSPTPTLPPSLTPTPDLRIINAPSETFILTLDDLPPDFAIRFSPVCHDQTDPHCQIASDRVEGPNLNYEILQEQGYERGSRYINDTLRVEGWYIYYTNESGYTFYPQTIMSNVIRFASSAGAQKYMTSYADVLSDNYTEVLGYIPVGDSARAYVRFFYGWEFLVYEFSYKNIVHRIWFSGNQENITPDLVHDLAFKALKRLQAADLNFPAPFVSPPTLTLPADSLNLEQRAITTKPYDLALSPLDLPAAGGYFLPDKYSSSPYHNNEVIQRYSGGQGSKYVNDTGRVDGWVIRYKRGANDLLLPSQISDSVSMYQTAEGAQKYLDEFSIRFFEEGWHEGVPPVIVGDSTRLFIKPDGVFIKYLLEFSYRNSVHSLQGYGLQAEVNPDFMNMIAFTLLQKLQAAP